MHCLGPGNSDLQVELLIGTIYEEKITVDSPRVWFPRNDLLLGVFGVELVPHWSQWRFDTGVCVQSIQLSKGKGCGLRPRTGGTSFWFDALQQVTWWDKAP